MSNDNGDSSLPVFETPALILNIDALKRNLTRMAEVCAESDIALRPHTKAHKSPWIAHQQVKHGAVGVCCAQVSEAEVMVRSGIHDVLITSELTPAKVDRVLRLARLSMVTVVVDSEDALLFLARRARKKGEPVGVLVDVDIGQNRGGTDPGNGALRLAKEAAESAGIRFLGLQGYESHLQQIRDKEERFLLAKEAYEWLSSAREKIDAAGIPVQWVTTGGTGTVPFAVMQGVATEVQPGSYVFMDMNYSQVEGIPTFEQALHVGASVIGFNQQNEAIIDVGWKGVTIEDGMPSTVGSGFGNYRPAGDEHGVVSVGKNPEGISVGDQCFLVPSHSDTTVNLYDKYIITDDSGALISELPIAARGYR